mmetsp:Transcript_78685/g.175953  ORF Transcript_78685/g.175953 Transcript_78685/m.175953 type:complete len:336 (-) Transcript_78685:420-1427(-)
MPHRDLLQEARELGLLDAGLLREARAGVPLEQLRQGHLVDLLELLGQALGPLEVQAPRRHAEGLPLGELRLLLEQELDGPLQAALGGVVVRHRHAAFAALPPELVHGQALPDQHVPQALHEVLAVHLRVEANAQLLVLRLQRQATHALQAVHLPHDIVCRLLASKPLDGDATSLGAILPQAGKESPIELVTLRLAVQLKPPRPALPTQLVCGELLPDERLLQPGSQDVGGRVAGQLPLLAEGEKLVVRSSLEAPHLGEDAPRRLHAREPPHGYAQGLPPPVPEQLDDLVARLAPINAQALVLAPPDQGRELQAVGEDGVPQQEKQIRPGCQGICG